MLNKKNIAPVSLLSWRTTYLVYLTCNECLEEIRQYTPICSNFRNLLTQCGPGSSVRIATELRAGWSGDRIPVEARFSVPVQTGPGAHPAFFTMGTGSFPGVKYGWGMLLTTQPLLMPWSCKSRPIPLPTTWATIGPVRGSLYILRFTHKISTQCHICWYHSPSIAPACVCKT
jgi:hypothetical protein